MPGRALRNKFIQKLDNARVPISKCYNCLEKCNPAKVPYCITKALIDAVKGEFARTSRSPERVSWNDVKLLDYYASLSN